MQAQEDLKKAKTAKQKKSVEDKKNASLHKLEEKTKSSLNELEQL